MATRASGQRLKGLQLVKACITLVAAAIVLANTQFLRFFVKEAGLDVENMKPRFTNTNSVHDVDYIRRVFNRTHESCGNWQARYISLHQKQKAKHGRIVVFTPTSGLGDRIAGLVTSLLFALLTDRAMLINWERMDLALISPSLGPILTNLSSEQSPLNLDTGNFIEMVEMDRQPSFRSSGGNDDVVFVTGNRGVVHHLFEMNHRGFIDLGLHPNTAFGCLLNFVVQPNPEIFTPYVDMIKTLDSRKVLSIGVQIRVARRNNDRMKRIAGQTGARRFEGSNAPVPEEMYISALSCAQSLQQKLKVGSRQVKYFVLSDSKFVQSQSINFLGSSNVLTVEAAFVKDANYTSSGTTVGDNSLISVVVDAWLFSLCDVHVFSYKSGLGRFASTLHLNQMYNTAYPVSANMKKLDPKRRYLDTPREQKFVSGCGKNGHASMYAVSRTGALL